MNFPPIEYMFFSEEQISADAWNRLIEFSKNWNKDHKSSFQFKSENSLSIIFSNGIEDEELTAFEKMITKLKGESSIKYFRGIVDKRNPQDYERSDYIEIVGDQYPLEFVPNYGEAIGPPYVCPVCGALTPARAFVKKLIVDESFLDKKVADASDYEPPGLDLINLPDGALLISSKIKSLLEREKIKGYELIEVISKQTGNPSVRIFLLKAGRTIMEPCNVHTPRDPNAICSNCGEINGDVLGYFYVPKEWLEGDQLFSREKFMYGYIYVSNKLYQALKNIGAKGILPSYGIYSCTHLTKE